MNEGAGHPTLLRPMTGDDLARVLAWRNHADIRRHMLTRHEISVEEHRRWFERASLDPSVRLMVFELVGTPLGFVKFSAIGASKFADWGFYTAPSAATGVGMKLGRTALRFAFEHEGLHKVCGQVVASNEASLRFHLKLGFVREGELREQHFDGRSYHNMIYFGVLRRDWLASASDPQS